MRFGSGQVDGPGVSGAGSPLDPSGSEVRSRFLLDCSAWSRMKAGRLDEREVHRRYLDQRSILVTTTVQVLEMLFTAQSPLAWEKMYANLRQYPLLIATELTHRIAIEIQRRLWHCGRKRAAGPIDVLIAAIALQYDATVIHYDADYQHIADVVPEFKHEWVAKRGTL
ncbi:PIN domain-containing protein [Nocardia nepalensis]|uniref:PIN domain-containing protein n=1 Tax=Nocardia nepalensis TaxID=3375448 RepID=UPI003B6772C0